MAFERIVPGTPEWELYYGNHIHRYRFAASFLKPRQPEKILDVACGVGYGSHFLAESLGCNVVAVDRSEEALRAAKQHFPSANIQLQRDDCHELRQCERFAPFDAVISMETLEHLQRPAVFLHRCRELLAPAGSMIVSTPRRRRNGKPAWDFHEHEYSAQELVALLESAGFNGINLFGQTLSEIGKLREEMRAELNRLYFNPAVRFGMALQRVFHRRTRPVRMPEREVDFETVSFSSASECDSVTENPPFILLATAGKS